ncbi:hypothetical protein DFH08DRAFT_958779 [Mycena albidolilacea]|uniref:Uncharacterized protein n=1 Tax=Mycena albidolilacea TaxID=1033008 RepID=A0AAD7A5B7_9AGAR|nr:hypothetical protein DFH08DRAFT_958779 [Mycena albidolilacea]
MHNGAHLILVYARWRLLGFIHVYARRHLSHPVSSMSMRDGAHLPPVSPTSMRDGARLILISSTSMHNGAHSSHPCLCTMVPVSSTSMRDGAHLILISSMSMCDSARLIPCLIYVYVRQHPSFPLLIHVECNGLFVYISST